jgi:hypothetical protein
VRDSSSDKRDASTSPAVPPPIMTKSYERDAKEVAVSIIVSAELVERFAWVRRLLACYKVNSTKEARRNLDMSFQ